MSQLKVEGVLALDGSGWDKTMRKAGDGVNKFTNDGLHHLKSAIVGAFAFGAIESFVHSTFEAATSIKHFSEQAGISAEEVQLLEKAARKVGLEFEDFQRALTKLGAARREAAESNKDLRNEFEAYGITLEDLNNPALKNVDLLEKMKHHMEDLAGTARGREELKDFFGAKGGDKIGAALEQYFKLKKNIADIHLLSDRDVNNIYTLEKSWKALKKEINFAGGKAVSGLTGLFSESSASGKLRSLDLLLTGHTLLSDTTLGPRSSQGGQGGHNPSKGSLMHGGESMFVDKLANSESLELADEKLKLQESMAKVLFDQLTPLQKEAQLRKEIAANLRAAASIERNNGGEQTLSSLDLRQKAVAQQGQLSSLTAGKPNSTPSDSLINVGNFLGTNRDSVSSIGQKTNDLLGQILSTNKIMADQLKALGPMNPFAGFL